VKKQELESLNKNMENKDLKTAKNRKRDRKT